METRDRLVDHPEGRLRAHFLSPNSCGANLTNSLRADLIFASSPRLTRLVGKRSIAFVPLDRAVTSCLRHLAPVLLRDLPTITLPPFPFPPHPPSPFHHSTMFFRLLPTLALLSLLPSALHAAPTIDNCPSCTTLLTNATTCLSSLQGQTQSGDGLPPASAFSSSPHSSYVVGR